MSDSRIIELILLAHREGFELPMPASEIIALEDDIRLKRALSVAPNIDFYRYQVSFSLLAGGVA